MAPHVAEPHESPVAVAFFNAVQSVLGSFVYFLGIIGDGAHSVRKSGHNYGAMRELDCTHPDFAHAVDIGVLSEEAALRILAWAYESEDVHYAIYKAVGYRPRWRGGARFQSSGHDHHVHISFTCGSTFHTAFEFGEELSMAAVEEIIKALRASEERITKLIKELDEDLAERGTNTLYRKKIDQILEAVKGEG